MNQQTKEIIELLERRIALHETRINEALRQQNYAWATGQQGCLDEDLFLIDEIRHRSRNWPDTASQGGITDTFIYLTGVV